MRSVAKHSYVKGASGKARMRAHVNYIQYREGDDRENKQPRQFFSADRDNIQGREVKRDIDEIERGRVVAHKLILSPGLQGVDLQAYTREVLQEVGREKGLDLDWRAVIHKNTDHDHAHVIIFGFDQNGREVRLDKADYPKLREAGDRYLERNHFYERFLARDSDRSMQHGYERDRGDHIFERLVKDLNRSDEGERLPAKELRAWDKQKAIDHLPDREKIEAGGKVYTKFDSLNDLKNLSERLDEGAEARLPKQEYQMLWQWIGAKEHRGDDYHERTAKEKWDKKERKRAGLGEDEREFKKFDKDLKRSIREMERGSGDFGKGHKQRLRETQGRLGAEHAHYTSAMEQQRINDLIERFPERKEELEAQLSELKRFDQEQRADSARWKDFDSLLGEGSKEPERGKGKDQSKVQSGERQLENEQLRVEQENTSGDQTERERPRDESDEHPYGR